MKNYFPLFVGILMTILASFTGLVLMSHMQLGDLKPVALEEGEDPYPREPSGIAQQGKDEYVKLGCVYCHSQQTRRKGFGGDFERGWGDRQTVARDYIYDKRVTLGTMRTGPDLKNVGQRIPIDDWHYLHLYDPQITSKGSIMPPFKYLFKKQKVKGEPHPLALKFPPDHPDTPGTGYEIIPTDRAIQLIEYLLSLKLDYELPESRFTE